MSTPYTELKEITDAVYSGECTLWGDDAIKLLLKYTIKLRDKDGVLFSKQFSIPKSESNCFVLGIRYKKKDNTFTEDLFLFRKNAPSIEAFYKGKLQEIFTEYNGTHKWQP